MTKVKTYRNTHKPQGASWQDPDTCIWCEAEWRDGSFTMAVVDESAEADPELADEVRKTREQLAYSLTLTATRFDRVSLASATTTIRYLVDDVYWDGWFDV